MCYVYVLQNETSGRLYKGFTSNLVQRIGQHNAGISKSTKNRGAWRLVYQEEFATRGEAMQREKFLKSGQGREFLKKILSDARSVG
jgi:putative endonuclease